MKPSIEVIRPSADITPPPGTPRSRNHDGNAQHEYKRSKHGKGRVHAVASMIPIEPSNETDGITVEVDGSAQPERQKSATSLLMLLLYAQFSAIRNSRCRRLGAECGKVRRSDVLHALKWFLRQTIACQTKLRQDVQQLQHNNNGIQGSEHLDGSRQTALGCDVGEQTCDDGSESAE